MEKPHFSCNLTALLEEFAQTLPEPVKTRPAFFLLALPSPSAARDIYADCVRFAGYARQIFPRKQVFSHHQLPFVRAAVQTSQEPPEALGQVMSVLEPLQQFSQMDLLNTLAVYLLDTNGSLEQTAGLLFLHKSTAKYRLRRANEALGFDIRQMPENYSLCFALAVGRLLE